MQLGTVIGHATATIKHPSLTGWRMLLIQPLNNARQPEGDPVITSFDVRHGPTTISRHTVEVRCLTPRSASSASSADNPLCIATLL